MWSQSSVLRPPQIASTFRAITRVRSRYRAGSPHAERRCAHALLGTRHRPMRAVPKEPELWRAPSRVLPTLRSAYRVAQVTYCDTTLLRFYRVPLTAGGGPRKSTEAFRRTGCVYSTGSNDPSDRLSEHLLLLFHKMPRPHHAHKGLAACRQMYYCSCPASSPASGKDWVRPIRNPAWNSWARPWSAGGACSGKALGEAAREARVRRFFR